MPRKRGKAQKWSDSTLEALSEVTPGDVETAKAWAEKYMEPGDGGLSDPAKLLEAQPADEK